MFWSKNVTSLTGRPQRDQEFSIPGFLGRDFAKSRDPGIFRDGIILKFLSRYFTKSLRYVGISLSAHKFGQFHTFWRTYLFVKYIRQTKVSSIPSCRKQQEWAGVPCCWQRGDPKKGLPHTKSNLGLLRDMGFRNKWEVNVQVNWLVPSCTTKPLTVSPCWILVAEKSKV